MAKPLTPKTALVIQSVSDALRKECTLEAVLGNDTLLGFANGEEFSRPQKGLIAATTSIMQDKIIDVLKEQADDLKQSLTEERFLLAGTIERTTGAIRRLYSLPLVQKTGNPESGNEDKPSKNLWEYLNWGNVAVAVAALLVSVAVFYTKAYSSYKDRAENQGAIIDGLNSQLEKLRNEKDGIEKLLISSREKEGEATKNFEYQRALAEDRDNRIKELEKQKDTTTATSAADSAEVAALRATVEVLRGELAARDAIVRHENETVTTFKRLYDEEKKKTDENRAAIIRVNGENNFLKTELEKYNGKRYLRNPNPT